MSLGKLPALLAVVLATLGGGLGALAVYEEDRQLSVATVQLDVSPFHEGALDIYVPLVDWGARFPGVRFPAHLKVDVRAVDRPAVAALARGKRLDVEEVRAEASAAIRSYLIELLLVVAMAALAAGGVAAVALRGRHAPRLRVVLAVVAATAIAATAVLALTLPPRGTIAEPEYYAYGPDIPRALRALGDLRDSTARLEQELDAQLVGLANLVADPARRRPLTRSPHFTIASDLHNNVLALPILERAARGGPVLFAGDVTDRGSPVEARLVRRIVQTGRPFVVVSGNHDSDRLLRRFARDGAVVLTQDGRLNPDGSLGARVVEVGGARIAGYSDPFERRAADDFADRYEPQPGPEREAAFASWLEPLIDDVDVVMVHDPNLARLALAELAIEPPEHPVVFVTGHSHRQALDRQAMVTVVNGGTVGAGGTGNLGQGLRIGLAVLAYAAGPEFEPLAVDLVTVDPATGSATARRERLDEPLSARR